MARSLKRLRQVGLPADDGADVLLGNAAGISKGLFGHTALC